MSENWVLVPEEAAPQMIEADLGYYQGGRTEDEQIVAESYKRMLAARPPVSHEWLDAAVERGLEKWMGCEPWHVGLANGYIERTRTTMSAAIIAALEMTDE